MRFAEWIRFAKGGLLLDDAGVVVDVGRARDPVGQSGDVGGTADVVERSGPTQLVLDGDEIDGLAPLVEADHRVEHALVRVPVEVVGVDELGRDVEGVVVDQDGPEHALLRLEVVGERPLLDPGLRSGHRVLGRDASR